MKYPSPWLFACRMTGCVAFCLVASSFSTKLNAQSADLFASANVASTVMRVTVKQPVVDLPEAPGPQRASAEMPGDDVLDVHSSDTQSSSSSTAQTPAPPAAIPAEGAQGKPITQEKTQRELAEEQLKAQQKQRVLGVVPNFNTSYVYGAASLTASQKFHLAFRSATDPVQFGFVTPFVALISQAEGSHDGYGGGIGGYAKRYGQTYADNFDGTMIGNAILPSLLHQDPRYFRLGRGSNKRRILYALGTNIICRHDGTGKWEPNYSNVLGNLAAGGISNLYLPEEERGFSSTVTGGLVVIAEGGLGSMFQEFWPDLSRHFLHKDPTGGQDDINRSQPDPTQGRRLFSNKKD